MATWCPWTDEEDGRLIDMANAGDSLVEIAKSLRRTKDSVVYRAGYIRQHRGADVLPERIGVFRIAHHDTTPVNVKNGGRGEQKPRICLGCGHTFSSAHCMNRLCNTCRGRSASPYAP